MTSENTALAIDLTQAILEQFWQQDTSLLLKYIDEDFSLTDALNHSIIQGQQQVCNFIPTAISGIIKSTLTDKMLSLIKMADRGGKWQGIHTLKGKNKSKRQRNKAYRREKTSKRNMSCLPQPMD